MSEGAKVPIITSIRVFVLVVKLTKLGFVASRVVQLLYLVVGPFTVAVGFRTRNMTVVVEVGPSPVFFVVVVQAHLPLMLVCITRTLTCSVTSHGLEGGDVKPEKLTLLKIVALPLVEHPAHLYWSLTNRARARSGFIGVRVIDILGVGMIVRALLSGWESTGESQ